MLSIIYYLLRLREKHMAEKQNMPLTFMAVHAHSDDEVFGTGEPLRAWQIKECVPFWSRQPSEKKAR
jgi:hypothetical protein